MGYVEHAVQAALAGRLVCTWIDRPGPTRQPVLPDACIDLVWDGQRVVVAGPDTHAWSIDSRDLTFVGVRFRPGAAPGFLRLNASELVDRTVPLADVWGGAANELSERLFEAGPTAGTRVFEEFLGARLPNSNEPDPLVDAMLSELREPESESATVEYLADRLALSPRSLHRRSVSALGYGPKMLDRILRFRRALRLARGQVGLAEAASRAGYADQAHLSNEFRRLGGATPRALIQSSRLVLSANGY